MINRIFKNRPEALFLAGLLVFGGGFFMMTNPRTLPPVLLIAGFFILYAVLHISLRLAVVGSGLADRLQGGLYRLVVWGGAALPVIFLALQSIGQLSSWDIITVLVLYAVGGFYMIRLGR